VMSADYADLKRRIFLAMDEGKEFFHAKAQAGGNTAGRREERISFATNQTNGTKMGTG